MRRIVLDTNVLVAGLLTPFGATARLIDALIAGEAVICYDSRILIKYRQVLERPKFGFDSDTAIELVNDLEYSGIRIVAPPLALTLPAPDDAMFIEVALAGHVDYLVTSNLRHFPAKSRSGELSIEGKQGLA